MNNELELIAKTILESRGRSRYQSSHDEAMENLEDISEGLSRFENKEDDIRELLQDIQNESGQVELLAPFQKIMSRLAVLVTDIDDLIDEIADIQDGR